MSTIYVKNFSEFPGPRYDSLGPNSGQKFRDEILIPELEKSSGKVVVNLDGTYGYGSSFLEEAFGGLVRKNISSKKIDDLLESLVSIDDPSLIDEIKLYIEEARNSI